MKIFRLLILTTISAVTVNKVIGQNILRVPTQYSTIQAAVDAAVDGDHVVLARGTYYGGINFNGKGITLRSDFTGETPSTADISETVIEGGLPGQPIIQTGGYQTAVYREIIGLTVRKGSLSGISFGGTGRIAYVIAEDNITAGIEAGGNNWWDTPPIIVTDCIIRRNKGGGLGDSYGSIHVFRTASYENNGAGFSFHEGYDLLIDCQSFKNGGGVAINSVTKVINCTITANTGLAIGVNGNIGRPEPVEIWNSILWGNGGSVAIQIPTILNYNCIQGGLEGISRPYERFITYGSENINTDPKFISPSTNDYRLADDSPAIGAGGALLVGVTPQ